MKYVLDASVALKFVLPEQDSDAALELEAGYREGVHELMAPDTYPIEIAHALTRAERRGILNQGKAATSLAQFLAFPPVLYPYLPLFCLCWGEPWRLRRRPELAFTIACTVRWPSRKIVSWLRRTSVWSGLSPISRLYC